MADNPTAFNAVVAQIRANAISIVSLQHGGITDADCVLLAAALQNSTSVISLDLSENVIGSSGASSLAAMLRVNRVLRQLIIHHNYQIGESGIISLANALQVNTALQVLDLNSHLPRRDSGFALANMLRVNTVLQTLLLGSLGNMANIAITALVQALAYNYRLTTFDFYSGNSNENTQVKLLLMRNLQCAGYTPPALQCPLLNLQPFPVQNAERLILTPVYLQITNMSYAPLNGNFRISNIINCQFLNAQNQSVTIFSQEDVNNGTVFLQHDGSGIAPSFNVTASYNDLETWPIPAVIDFTLMPLISSTTQSTTSLSITTTSIPTSVMSSSSTSRSFTMTPTTQGTSSSHMSSISSPFTSTSITQIQNFSTSAQAVSSSFTQPSSTSSTAQAVSNSGASANIGPVIGGVAAGAFAAGAAAVGVGVFLLNRRRRQRTQIAAIDPNTIPMTDNPMRAINESAAVRVWDTEAYAVGEPAHQTKRDWDPNLYETGEHEPRATLRRDARLDQRAGTPSPPLRPAKK